MFDQVLRVLQTFFGRTAGKFIAGVALCFGLGVMAAYTLPQYLVTVNLLHAEVSRLEQSSERGDKWQELNTLELRSSMQESKLWDLEETVDSQGKSPSERQKGRLQALRESLQKLKAEMRGLRSNLSEGGK